MCPAYIYIKILAILNFRWVKFSSLTKFTFYVVAICSYSCCGVKSIHINRLHRNPYFGKNTEVVLKSIWQTESLTFFYQIFTHGSQEMWKIFEVNSTYRVTYNGENTTHLLRIIPHIQIEIYFDLSFIWDSKWFQ
jgi:hypothetical protein